MTLFHRPERSPVPAPSVLAIHRFEESLRVHRIDGLILWGRQHARRSRRRTRRIINAYIHDKRLNLLG